MSLAPAPTLPRDSTPTISTPTTISAGAVATDGIAPTSATNGSASRKSTPGHDGDQPGAPARGDARGRFDVGRRRRGADDAAADRAEGVDQQRSLRVLQLPLVVEVAGLGCRRR